MMYTPPHSPRCNHPTNLPTALQGVRRASLEGWRPAGDNDGSAFLRPMTEAEMAEQAANC